LESELALARLIFTQICLADEINRATPKTQSALLEAMQEKSISTRARSTS